ncbi:T9SS type A sorting domain-containing protein [Tenacibaculum jejuense]|uniref:Secretion system C-terminal sorting domain-containing protein n=1 Tax=Tenacibaculum jejuense TaxID=584609 RepID=A0A238U564_9FLAO|nr:T9SS type A sorting domain-containing protein [Tenacibaculum jejuense]SNR14156.1 Protein of unknown function precursor containing a C-terminal secretion signal [Tenacibaculum jejuense]
MKHLLLLLTFGLFFHTIKAQNTELLTEIEHLQGPSALKGNELYLVKQQHKNGVYSINSPYDIIKIDLLKKKPYEIVFSGINFGVSALAFRGNELYMSLSDGRFNIRSEIAKIDVTAKNPRLTSIVKNVNRPNSFTFLGNELYVLRNPQGSTLISKINVADINPVLKDVIELATNREQGRSIVSDGKQVYVSLFKSDRIVKVNVTAIKPTITDVLTGIKNPNALAFSNNELYVGFDSKDDSDKYQIIAKADITAQTITPTIINEKTFRDINAIIPHQSGLHISYHDIVKKTFKNGITVNITDRFNGKIARLNSAVLSTVDISDKVDTNFKLYPNPSKEFVQILNLEDSQNYILYKIDGSEVNRGVVTKNEKIATQMLSSGLYFLKLKNNTILKFVKN